MTPGHRRYLLPTTFTIFAPVATRPARVGGAAALIRLAAHRSVG